jgi:hypothetical protein
MNKLEGFQRRKIGLVESNDKCSYLTKLTCKGTLRQVFICLRPPPLLGFCLGWNSNFVGPESGQKQSVKLLQNMVFNTTQHLPPPLPDKHCLYILYFDFGKGGSGGGYPKRRLEGQKFTKLGRKYQHD